MDSSNVATNKTDGPNGKSDIAIVGGGPSGLVLAIALARRGCAR